MTFYIWPQKLRAGVQAPALNTAGFRSFIWWRAGGLSAPPGVKATTKHVGWPDTGRLKRYKPEVLEALLRQQRESGPFTRTRFEQLLNRSVAAAEAASNKLQRRSIKRAVAEAELLPEVMPDPAVLMATLEAAISARRAKEAIEFAGHAEAMVKAYLAELEQDEEEAIALLF